MTWNKFIEKLETTTETSRAEIIRGHLVICVPVDIIRYAAERHPHTPLRITDEKAMLRHIADNIFDFGDDGGNNSQSKFHRLLDQLCMEAAEDGAGAELDTPE